MRLFVKSAPALFMALGCGMSNSDAGPSAGRGGQSAGGSSGSNSSASGGDSGTGTSGNGGSTAGVGGSSGSVGQGGAGTIPPDAGGDAGSVAQGGAGIITAGIGGDAGSGGSPPIGGSGGSAGFAGGGGVLVSACEEPPSTTNAFGCVLDSEGALVRTSMTGPVTVVRVEDATSSDCGMAPGLDAKRFVLRDEDDSEWSAIVGMTDLPEALLEVDESLDLTLDVAEDTLLGTPLIDQTLVLTRGKDLVLFSLAGRNLLYLSAPFELPTTGVTISTYMALCTPGYLGGICRILNFPLIVTRFGESLALAPGEVGALGDLHVGLGTFTRLESLDCDTTGTLNAAGFVEPAGE